MSLSSSSSSTAIAGVATAVETVLLSRLHEKIWAILATADSREDARLNKRAKNLEVEAAAGLEDTIGLVLQKQQLLISETLINRSNVRAVVLIHHNFMTNSAAGNGDLMQEQAEISEARMIFCAFLLVCKLKLERT